MEKVNLEYYSERYFKVRTAGETYLSLKEMTNKIVLNNFKENIICYEYNKEDLPLPLFNEQGEPEAELIAYPFSPDSKYLFLNRMEEYEAFAHIRGVFLRP